PLLEHELAGLVAAVQQRGVDNGVPTALLSGGVAGVVGRSFVMTLPGSSGGVKDGIAVLDPVLDHLIAQLEGAGDHE
ncbi:MAG: MogA/MoaB family molybdenum cofactor biosynthesis protein, partial [Candidatus Corynebacterium faecigallinarum]